MWLGSMQERDSSRIRNGLYGLLYKSYMAKRARQTTTRTSSVEFQCRLQRDLLFGTFRLCVLLLSCVETVNVGLMMFGVVQLHYLFGDVWLKGLYGIVSIYMIGRSQQGSGHTS